MNILLVHPTPPRGYWPRGVFLPLCVPTEMAHAAALLRQQGHQVLVEQRDIRLLQCEFDWDTADARFMTLLQEHDPAMVVFFTPTATAEETFRLAGMIRTRSADATTILACGPHPTALPEQTLGECPNLTAVLVGEWEWTLLEAAHQGRTKGIAGLRTPSCKNAEWLPRPGCTDLDKLPPPAWDLFAMEPITRRQRWLIRWLPLRTLNLRTSRGCPNACSYCAAPLTAGTGVRLHSVDYVMAMLERGLNSYPLDAVLFEDETFAADEGRLLQICDAMRKRGWSERLRWACCLRTDQARPALLREMKAAGCRQIEYGFETASDRLLKQIGKNTTCEQNLAAARYTREAGMRIFANIMFGLPGETADDMDNSLGFIRAIRPEVLSATAMIPLPGTELYRNLSPELKSRLAWGDLHYFGDALEGFNPTAMSDALWNRKFRQVQKYFVKPLLWHQLLRDAGDESSADVQFWKKNWRRFQRRHPFKALRLPT